MKKHTYHLGAVAIIGLLTLGVIQPVKANLISNGGFETGDFTGWTQSGNTEFSGVNGTFLDFPPHSGSFQAVFGPVGSSGFIGQNLTTTVGASYVLTGWLVNLGGPGNFFAIYWGGSSILSLTDWPSYSAHFRINVTAETASTPLQFEFLQGPSFFLLDDVSVRPVPDAGSTFSLLGLASLSIAALRRKLSPVRTEKMKTFRFLLKIRRGVPGKWKARVVGDSQNTTVHMQNCRRIPLGSACYRRFRVGGRAYSGSMFLIPMIVASFLSLQSAQEAKSAPATADPASWISVKWIQLGGAPVMGYATSDVQDTPGGHAAYQTFRNGVIVYSNDFGAVYITQEILDKWLSLQSGITGDGTNLFSFVGVPTRDFAIVDGHQEGTFERGRIIVAGPVPRIVYGEIYARYPELAGRLGLPVAEEASSTGNGRFQLFERGEIHWNPDIGAFGVWGPILGRWQALGGPAGTLGFPHSDVTRILAADGITPIGVSGRFDNGAIFFSDASGAWEVTGEILTTYETKLGGPAGWIGFPISGEGIAASRDHFNNFQHGVMVDYQRVTPPGMPAIPVGVKVFGSLDVSLSRIQGFGDDCFLCGGQDVYAYLTVDGPAGRLDRLRLPKHGDGGSSYDLSDQTFKTLKDFIADRSRAVANSSSRYDVSLDVWDADVTSGDDFLGNLSDSYTIDNLWGRLMSSSHSRQNAGATFTVEEHHDFSRDDFRGQLWWSFDNFDTPTLTYDQFATTFVDVNPGEKAWPSKTSITGHPFNKLFYELFYKKRASSGNCHGMALESIFAQVGRSLYREPIHDYFDDTQGGQRLDDSGDPQAADLINEINIKHGYTLGATNLEWWLAMFALGMTHNPALNFSGAWAANAIGQYPLITMTDDLLFGNAHTVRPYSFDLGFTYNKCRGENPPCGLIWVANPNVPTAVSTGEPGGTSDEPIVIELNPIRNTFHYFDRATEVEYRGNFLKGGRMVFQPFKLYSGPQHTPMDHILQLIKGGFLFIVGTTAKTNQITDGEGHTFFRTDLPGPPTFWDDLRREDDPQHVPNLAPIVLSDAALPTAPSQMFTGRGVGATHTYDVLLAPDLAEGTVYEATFESAKLSSYFAIPGTPNKPESIMAHDIGGPSKKISVSIPSDSQAKSITWTIAGPEEQRWAELTELTMVPGQKITMGLENTGWLLTITNDGPDTSAHLRVKGGSGEKPLDDGTLDIPAGTTSISLQPALRDVTTDVAIRRSDLVLIRSRNGIGEYAQRLTVRNASGGDIKGPVYLVLTGLDPQTQTLVNRASVTTNLPPLGRPFGVLNFADNDVFSDGEYARLDLKFTSPVRSWINYTIQAMAGNGLPP